VKLINTEPPAAMLGQTPRELRRADPFDIRLNRSARRDAEQVVEALGGFVERDG